MHFIVVGRRCWLRRLGDVTVVGLGVVPRIIAVGGRLLRGAVDGRRRRRRREGAPVGLLRRGLGRRRFFGEGLGQRLLVGQRVGASTGQRRRRRGRGVAEGA